MSDRVDVELLTEEVLTEEVLSRSPTEGESGTGWGVKRGRHPDNRFYESLEAKLNQETSNGMLYTEIIFHETEQDNVLFQLD